MDKRTVARQVTNYFLVILGTFLLAFGSVIFLSEAELVAGGVSGIAIIVQHYINTPVYDYIVAGLIVGCWIIGLLFVGRDFALKTLLSSVLYIGFTFLFKRVDFFLELAHQFAYTYRIVDGVGVEAQEVGNLILCGIFGGVFVGGGVAFAFLGGGSSGGVDVFQVLLSKYLNIKESLSSFIIDASIIVVGMLTVSFDPSNSKWNLNPALCGILSSFVTAVLIEIVYIRNQSAYQVDIISDKWEEISRYAQDELDRGATIIPAKGGYKGEERVILRVVFDKLQYEKIRQYIASIDPKAFITFTQTNAVFGEGFKHNHKIKKNTKK